MVIAAVGIVTVPVKVGDSFGAFASILSLFCWVSIVRRSSASSWDFAGNASFSV